MKSRLQRTAAELFWRLGEIGGFVGGGGSWVDGIGNWRGGRGFFLRRLFCGFGAFALLVTAVVELLVGGLFLHIFIVTQGRPSALSQWSKMGVGIGLAISWGMG